MQEAFIAALLSLLQETDQFCNNMEGVDDVDEGWYDVQGSSFSREDDLERYPLWIAIKKQIVNLRKGIEDKESMA